MKNVQKPDLFLANLTKVNEAFYQLLELCREEELAPVREDGCILYDDENSKACFQVAGQYRRPGEFLAALLDMLRVTYEPNFIGTFFLNANPIFIYEGIPEQPFRLGYLSLISSPGESFTHFWNGKVAAAALENHYELDKASSTYIVVASSAKRMDMLDEVFAATQAGFSVDEALDLISSCFSDGSAPHKKVHAGFVWDESLDTRLRVSVWMIFKPGPHLTLVS